MKRVILTSLLLIFTIIGIFAQENKSTLRGRKNAVFIEGGGSAVWYSVNYERRVSLKPMNRLTFGGGVSLIPVRSDGNLISLLSAGYLYGEKHNFEAGISGGYYFTEPEFIGSVRIGYRYEGLNGLQFRIGFSPIYGKFQETGLPEYSGKGVLPWAYLSVGYTF